MDNQHSRPPNSEGPPKGGFSAMSVELIVSDFARSFAFWVDVLGFGVSYSRPTQKFVYLQHPDGAQMMFYERDGDWETGKLEMPFGRGAIIQLRVSDVELVHSAVTTAGIPLYVDLREKWRDWGDRLGGQREFLVQDPDGYLVMVSQMIGEKPLSAAIQA